MFHPNCIILGSVIFLPGARMFQAHPACKCSPLPHPLPLCLSIQSGSKCHQSQVQYVSPPPPPRCNELGTSFLPLGYLGRLSRGYQSPGNLESWGNRHAEWRVLGFVIRWETRAPSQGLLGASASSLTNEGGKQASSLLGRHDEP